MHDECLCAAMVSRGLNFGEVKMHFVIAFGGATTHKIVLVLTFMLLRSCFANVITVHLKSWCKSMWRLNHNGHKHLDISRLTTQPSL